MSFDPTSIISLIQNCKTLYDYFADVKHSSTERRRLLDEVRALQPELEALQRLAATPGIAGNQASLDRMGQLLDPVQPFSKVVNETLGRIEDVLKYGTSNPKANRFKIFGKRLAPALLWTADKTEVKDLLSDLERYKSRIALALQHDIFNHIITEYRLKVAKFISENDYVGHQRSLVEERLPETGTWVLQHPKFVAWRDDSDSERTIWCHGFAGVGKSVITAFLVEHLQSMDHIVLSVFCRYSADTFTTPFPVLRGLLRQLIEKSPNIPPALYDLYRTQTNPEPEALPGLLNELAAIHRRPIYIIIDALDECPIRIALLRAVQDLTSSFRTLVTSRPVFGEIHEHTTIEIRAADKDILTAVDTTLRKLKHAWLDEELKQAIRDKVVEKAGGMFLLASLQLRELERDVTCRGDVVAVIDTLPPTLDDAYKLTFERIHEQGTRKNELACRTLAIIALNPVLLWTKRVQHLLAEGDVTQYTDIETMLQCCHGLVRRTTDDNLEFIHYSVHEYITAHWSELFPENPNQPDVCLQLGYSVLTSPVNKSGMNHCCWDWIVHEMREPEEIKQVMFLLSTPKARALLVEYDPDLAPFVHDPLLIACHYVQRFNEALHLSRIQANRMQECMKYIDARPDMQVHSDGVVVAVDPEGGEWISSDAEDDNSESSSGDSEDDDTSADVRV